MMDEYKKNDNFHKFYSIIHSALVSKRRVDELIKILEVIRDFEYRLHYESYETLYEIEKKLLTRDVLPLQTKTQSVEIDSNSLELALNYLPFWDTNIGQGTDKDSVLARTWFEISIQEAYTMSKAINCFSIREFIAYYRINQRMYSQNEVLSAKLDQSTKQEGDRRCENQPVLEAGHLSIRAIPGFSL